MKIVYVKTTETCNLDCSHCYTNGRNGAKGFFDPKKTAEWLNQLGSDVHIEYHGGEPFLAPLELMYKLFELTDADSYGCTTNLTFNLDIPKIEFIQTILNSRIATSWDKDIRWANTKQKDLWEKNVRTLVSLGVHVKVFISMNKELLTCNPADILVMLKDLGIKEVAFERLTHHGNATRNPEIFPTNKELDDWIYELHEATETLDAREWFYNALLESVYAKWEKNSYRENTFCRDCEQKIFTINADGSISGCPNGGPTDIHGHINMSLSEVLKAPSRICIIAKEQYIDHRCLECPFLGKCGGDCHRLEWDTQCPAPKRLFNGLNHKANRIV